MVRRSPLDLAIQQHPHPEYSFKESPSAHLPRPPLRGLLLGPSGSGKGVLLCDLLVRIYAGCFERIYVWSPSVDLDHQWDPVKRYSERVLKVDQSKEKTFFNTWDEGQVREIIRRHTEVTLSVQEAGRDPSIWHCDCDRQFRRHATYYAITHTFNGPPFH